MRFITKIKEWLRDPFRVDRDWGSFDSLSEMEVKELWDTLREEDPLGEAFRRLTQYIATRWVSGGKIGCSPPGSLGKSRIKLSVVGDDGVELRSVFLKHTWSYGPVEYKGDVEAVEEAIIETVIESLSRSLPQAVRELFDQEVK